MALLGVILGFILGFIVCGLLVVAVGLALSIDAPKNG